MPDAIESVDIAGVHGAIVLNPDGSAIGTPVGGATSDNQTNGSQKTQIVDAGGEAVTVTGGKLDVNASASLSGESIPATGATTAVTVQIADGSGNQITSFGGGTQYTDGDTDASITGTAIMFETNTGTNAIGVVNASNPLPVSASIDTTGLATTTTDTNTTTIAGAVSGGEMQVSITSEGALSVETTQQSVLGEVSDINSNTASIDTKTPALGQALAAGSVPVVLTAAQLTTLTPPAAITGFGTSANQTTIIGHLDGVEGLLTTIDADTGNIATAVTNLPTVFGTTSLVTTTSHTDDLANSIDVLNVRNINYVFDGTTWDRQPGNSTDGTLVNLGANNDVTVTSGTITAVTAITNALPAGTNAIGKLAANSGVDIGDVDVTSISAGTNAIGNVGLIGRTTGGLTIFRSIDIDETEEEVKATAGQLFSITAFNTTAAPLYLKFYNATAATTTVGTTTPVLTFLVPANADSDGAGFVWNNDIGFAFGTAISVACTTAVADADTGAPGANACIINLGYM